MQSRSIAKNPKADHDLAAANGHRPGPEPTPTAEVEVVTEPEATEATPAKPISRFSAYVLADEGEDLGEEPLLTACPAHSPKEADLFRVRPDDGERLWRMKTLIVDYRGEDPAVARGFYLIHPRLVRVFAGIGKPHLLLTCVTVYGGMFIWPVRLVDGFGDSWSKSKLRIATLAERDWVRIQGAHGNGYAAVVSRKDHGQPKWQGESFDELLGIAFDGRIVEDLAHPLAVTFELG
jgi:hypothetical protein